MRPLPVLLAAAMTVAALSIGCSSDNAPQPLAAEAFYRPRDMAAAPPPPAQAGIGENFNRPQDRGGALPPGTPPTEPQVPPVSAVNQNEAADNLRVVTEQVKPVHPSDPTTAPALPAVTSKPAEAYAPGVYLVIGGVIAEVNGAPIYADDVLRSIAPVLAAKAKEVDESAFRAFARNEINTQVDDMIRAEVEFAAADRNTTSQEKEMAARATEQWRTTVITRYKGSLEEARSSFREQGRTFDEALREQNRTNLVRVYYSRKILPRIAITATEMRTFYERNKETLFTERDAMTFRLIKISPQAVGNETAARERVDELATRARNGEDFATLAGSINNDPLLLKNAGLVGPIDKGAFRLEEIEKALWKLNVGQVTPVIQVGGDYYLARLEDKRTGRVLQFQEDAVQKKMTDAIKGEQFARMRREMEASLRRESVVSKNAAMYDSALAMAMQNYSRWHGNATH